jgi:YD repeat-containing protein
MRSLARLRGRDSARLAGDLSYNVAGTVASLLEFKRKVTTFAYDNQNRLVSKATPEGTLTYAYDAAGNRLTASSSNTKGTSAVYTYDALNRLQTVADNNAAPGLKLTAYSYDAVGNLASTALPNGVVVTPSVDRMNRVTDLLTARQAVGSGNVSAYSYQYGAVGNRTYAAGSAGGPSVSSTYGYDPIYRLTQESLSSAGAPAENGTRSAHRQIGAVYRRKTPGAARSGPVAGVSDPRRAKARPLAGQGRDHRRHVGALQETARLIALVSERTPAIG